MNNLRVISLLKGFIFVLFALYSSLNLAATPQLLSLRSNSLSDKVQLVFDVSAQPNVSFSLKQQPLRLVVDLKAIPAKTYQNLLSFHNRGIVRLHTKMHNKDTIRVSIELSKPFPYNVYEKAKSGNKPERIVVDIYDRAENPQQVQARIIQSHQTHAQQTSHAAVSSADTRFKSTSKTNTSPETAAKTAATPTFRVINATDLVSSETNSNPVTKAPAVKKALVKKEPNKQAKLVPVSLTSTDIVASTQTPKPSSSKAEDVKWKKVAQTTTTSNNEVASKKASLIIPKPQKATRKTLLVVIDPGHGGKDSGAIGANGTYEKHVALQISKRLKKHIDALPNTRAILTRNNDRYITLYGRTRFARQKKADLFISIHADAFTRRDVQGSSVFILSTRGASSAAARELAKRENSVDSKHGLDFKNYDRDISKVLMDIQQSATIESSYVLASKTLRQLKGIGKVHKRYVERAGFAVLKSPDIPSMLVETAFISNPSEERKLNNPAYQERIAKAITLGVKSYFAENLPHHILLGQTSADKVE